MTWEKVREALRKLETMVIGLDINTPDQAKAVARIRGMIGEQLAELTWFRAKCADCDTYVTPGEACSHCGCTEVKS